MCGNPVSFSLNSISYILKVIYFFQDKLERMVDSLKEELNEKKGLINNLKETNSKLFINCSKIEDENKSLKNDICLLKQHKQDLILEVVKGI